MNHQIMFICILVGKLIINIFSVYAPQTGLSVVEKDSFSSAWPSNISTVSPDEYLLACGDFNWLVEKAPGFNGVHGGLGFGSSNADGIKILDICTDSHETRYSPSHLPIVLVIHELKLIISSQDVMI